ncbi:MAG: aldose 1-epimerase family protein, partial [Hyphomicrobiales bacterium]
SGSDPLPYSIGHHPAFVLDAESGSRPRYRIEFASAETGKLPCISSKGLFTDQTRVVDLQDGHTLHLDDAVFAEDALCFLNARSDSLRLVSEDGSAIRAAVENLPHFAIWSKQGAPFVSVECWSGHGDPDGYSGNIFNKPSISVLNPSGVGTHTIRYSFEGA